MSRSDQTVEAPVVPRIGDGGGERLVTEADWIPGFWNFLLALDRNDLIAELVQNDLDQQATRTVISFEPSQLVCEGNGRAVEPDGWQRLRKIQGAGDSVPAKQGKIGVKNHGLKTAFTIGDQLWVLSAGKAITQTLFAHGRQKAPYPGASLEPRSDPKAPGNGCRVVIRYRDKNIEPRQGEAIVFAAVGTEEIDALFKSACATTPEQFAGIVSPEVAPRYEIVLRHWRLGDAHFAFSCTRARKVARNIEVFGRRCEVSGSGVPLPTALHEEAARRSLPFRGRLRERVPDFFRRRNRFFVEVSWSVDKRGTPRLGTGRFRYPIGYPESSHEARTGHGAFFNAPVVSDIERHGPARNDATNKELRQACETLLVDVAARRLIPKWGACGLYPLVPNPQSTNQDEAVRPLLAALVQRDAMPTITSRNAVDLLMRAKARKAKFSSARSSNEPRKYRFVVPVPTWEEGSVHASLAAICPVQEKQLDPRVHPDIIRLLVDHDTKGFGDEFVTFDEDDALCRATGEGNQYFAACENPEREFADPFVALCYLDVIKESTDHPNWKQEKEGALQSALLLPDTEFKAHPFHNLHASVALPSSVPGLRVPPILHQAIASHGLFRRKKWRRPKYTMAKFLESGALQEADEGTRKLFWRWLRENERRIGSQERAALAGVAIWPDVDGKLCLLSELCDPRSRLVAKILGEAIHRPHDHVRRSGLTTFKSSRRTSLRRVATEEEVRAWLERRTAGFAVGKKANADTIAALDRLESDLAVLLRDQEAGRALRAIRPGLPALAHDGSVQQRGELASLNRITERLGLRPRFLLKDKRAMGLLNKLCPALPKPSIAMILSSFEEDSENFNVLQARLQQFLDLTQPSDGDPLRLAGMGILPVDGKPHAPRDLAFVGPKGDYWGAWKTRITVRGLSQDDQKRYLAVGVTSASPTSETSRAFFTWLSRQEPGVLKGHIACVLRQILHANGPTNWAGAFTDLPFIPTRYGSDLQLVSLRTARRRPVYLPDARVLAEQVIENDPGVRQVIARVQEVSEPISELLRRLGVRSLREAMGEPNYIEGSGSIEEATAMLRDRLDTLRSSKFQRTLLKRMDELGVSAELIRHDWHDRLSRIIAIRFAEDIQAQYRFRGKNYRIPADAGFDPESGTFWIKAGKEGLGSLYESIARQLVFKPAARPIDLLALERAVQLEIHELSFGQAVSLRAGQMEEGTVERIIELDDGKDTEPGEAVFGHSPFQPDPSKNVPKPTPLPSNSRASPGRREDPAAQGRLNKAADTDTHSPELEKEHIERLKRQHYASHCQMCLCERPPSKLAPPGSYVEWEEVRRRVVEAHHVDLKSGGGARHAGNLVLLCKLHHDNYGRRLTREAVTGALREKRNEKVVRFGKGDGTAPDVNGRVVAMVIPDTGEVVSIFFTNDHADYWLSNVLPVADNLEPR